MPARKRPRKRSNSPSNQLQRPTVPWAFLLGQALGRAEYPSSVARFSTLLVLIGIGWVSLGQAPASSDGAALLKRLEAASAAGNAESAFRLGELYRAGQVGVTHDIRRAIQYYRQAVRLGNHPGAMNTLGILYEQGVGVTASQSTAVEWYEKAARAGSAMARANLGKIHARGEAGGQDYRLATAELKKAAGDWVSLRFPMSAVGLKRGVPFSFAGMSLIQAGAEPEYDWTASRKIKWTGQSLRRPVFDPNYDSAKPADITVVDLRSEGDDLLIDIGIFDTGKVPLTKPVQFVIFFDLDGRANAVSLFQLSGAPAQKPEKLPNADYAVQVVLGVDRAKPLPAFLLSATAPQPLPEGRFFRGNNAGAQHDLGIIYTYGKKNAPEVGGEINQNYQTAADWYFRAAEQSHAGAQNNLGVLYFKGTQTRRDQRRLLKRDPDPNPIEQAAYWYRMASGQGYADAHANLGFLYETGLLTTDILDRKIPNPMIKARELYLKAADPGEVVATQGESAVNALGEAVPGLAVAQHHLGSLHDPDEPLAKDLSSQAEQQLRQAKNADRAEFWYRQASARDYAPSQLRLAKRILARNEVSPDARLEALKWLYLVADNSEDEAVHDLRDHEAKQAGVLAESARLEADLFLAAPENPEPSDQRAKVERLAKQARFGDVKSIYELGHMFQMGTAPLKQDYARAYRLYLRAAKEGNTESQFRLGSLYNSGVGVPYSFRQGFGGALSLQLPDQAEAAKWYEMAAEGGHAEAAYYLGNLYAEGSFKFKRDFRKAADWFRKAANLGHAGAMNNLGYLYDEGLGVKQDRKAAFAHYKKGAEAGHAGAQLNLSAYYSAGLGGAGKDLNQALIWAEKAAAQGEPGAGEKVAAIRHLLRK